jgi:hypothetical protein
MPLYRTEYGSKLQVISSRRLFSWHTATPRRIRIAAPEAIGSLTYLATGIVLEYLRFNAHGSGDPDSKASITYAL